MPASACESKGRPSAPEQESRRKRSCANTASAGRAHHRRDRVTSEARLEHSHDRLADSRQRGLWPGFRPDSIHDGIRLRIDEHLEELFTCLRVVRQRSVGEAKPGDIIQAADTVENTATVQGPEPEVANQNRYDGSNRDRGVPRERFNPADVELSPGDQGGSGSLELGFAVPNRNGRLIEV